MSQIQFNLFQLASTYENTSAKFVAKADADDDASQPVVDS